MDLDSLRSYISKYRCSGLCEGNMKIGAYKKFNLSSVKRCFDAHFFLQNVVVIRNSKHVNNTLFVFGSSMNET